MKDLVKAAVDAPGLRLRFEGSRETWVERVLPLLGPVARGEWSEGAGIPGCVEGPPEPGAAAPPPAAAASPPPPAPSPAAAPVPAPRAAALPAAVPAVPAAPSPSPSPSPSPAAASSWDPAPLYARLAKEEGRRAERDAVLLALVSLAAAGRRDATPAEVLAHMEKHGYPSAGVKVKPVLAKLCHRKGVAVPGVLPNTFRATPAGSAYVWKRAREA